MNPLGSPQSNSRIPDSLWMHTIQEGFPCGSPGKEVKGWRRNPFVDLQEPPSLPIPHYKERFNGLKWPFLMQKLRKFDGETTIFRCGNYLAMGDGIGRQQHVARMLWARKPGPISYLDSLRDTKCLDTLFSVVAPCHTVSHPTPLESRADMTPKLF